MDSIKKIKAIFLTLLMLWLAGIGPQVLAQQTCQSLDISGRWLFYKIIFRGQDRPPFSDNLVLSFEFSPDGKSFLHWERTGENGFCERRGEYTYDGETLRDKIVWVNPKNNWDCGRDPDMQLGKETITPLKVIDGELHTELSLSGEALVYVWKKWDQEN